MTGKIKHPLLLLLMALLYTALGCIGAVAVKIGLNAAGLSASVWGKMLQATLQITLVLLSYGLYVKKYERRSLTEYPKNRQLEKIGMGVAAGAGLIGLQVAFLALSGHYEIITFQPSGEVLKYLFLMILVGFLEELVTRGIIFRLVEKWAGSVVALLLVTVGGALAHATNPNSSLWSGIAVGLEFGVLMSLVYMVTRNLWTVSALHFAWNFTMGGVFGIAVSGTEAEALFRSETTGPVWLTGGEFGIEAGLPAVIITVLISLRLVSKLRNTG